jgi:hypothetical protein
MGETTTIWEVAICRSEVSRSHCEDAELGSANEDYSAGGVGTSLVQGGGMKGWMACTCR